MDKISVIISGPASDGFLASAIRSIFHSTYRNLEVILLDDGSLPEVAEIAEEFDNKIVRVKSLLLSRAGLWNEGARRASGEMLSFFEAKDISGKMRLELSVKKMLDDLSVGLVFCGTTYINSEDGFLQGVNLLKEFIPDQGLGKLFEGCFIASLSTTVITREAFEKAGRFDEELDINCEYDLFLRIARQFRLDYINLPLLRYRVAPGGSSVSEERWSEAERYILKKHDIAAIADSLTRLYAKEDRFRVALGKILSRMGRFDDAMRNFMRAIAINGSNSEAHFLTGNYYYYKGDFERASHWYNECLRLDPDHAGSRNNLGVLYYITGAWDESRVEFDRAKKISSNYYDPIFNLQCLQHKAGAERLRITGGRERNAFPAFQERQRAAYAEPWPPGRRIKT